MKTRRFAKLQNLKKIQEDKKKKFDIVGHLPPEVGQKILLQLKPNVIWHAWNANERWKQIMRDDFFWKLKYQRDDLENPKRTFQSERCKKFLGKFNQWQGEYLYNQALTSNWKNDKFERISLLKSNYLSIDVGKLIYFDDEICIVNFSHTNTSLFNTSTGVIEKVFRFDDDNVNSDVVQLRFFLKSEDFLYLFFATTDEMLTVQAWNIKTKEFYFRRNLGINRHLASEVLAYRNAVAIIDNANNFIYYPLQSTPITVEEVRSVDLFENMAVLETTDCTLQIMNMDNRFLTPIRCCTYQDVHQTDIMGKYIVSYCIQGHLSTWDINDNSKFTTFPIQLYELDWDVLDASRSYFLLDVNKMAYLREGKKSLRIRDIFSGNILTDIKDNEDQISSFTKNNRFVFTFCDEKILIKMWCCNTGQYIKNVGIYSLPVMYPRVTDTKMIIPFYEKPLDAVDFLIYDFEAKIKIPRKSYQ